VDDPGRTDFAAHARDPIAANLYLTLGHGRGSTGDDRVRV
jgi:hypothetical protein